MRQTHRTSRFGTWLLVPMLLAACGPGVPDLMPVESIATLPSPGDAARGAARFTDRTLSHVGLACADCHPSEATPGRPAPSLHRWAAGAGRWAGRPVEPGASLAACVELHLARPPLAVSTVADLRAAVAVEPPAPGPPAYATACAHCHDDGPVGDAFAIPRSRRAFVVAVRDGRHGLGPQGAPPFAAVDAVLIEAMYDARRPTGSSRPAVGGTLAPATRSER